MRTCRICKKDFTPEGHETRCKVCRRKAGEKV